MSRPSERSLSKLSDFTTNSQGPVKETYTSAHAYRNGKWFNNNSVCSLSTIFVHLHTRGKITNMIRKKSLFNYWQIRKHDIMEVSSVQMTESVLGKRCEILPF